MTSLAKILSLSYNSAVATVGFGLKSYYRSVRLVKDVGTINPGQPSYVTNILLCGNCVDPTTRNLYVFYIDTYFGSAWIIEINIDTRVQTVVYYDKYNAIGFNANNKFRNARVVFGRLIWTDNVNPIYQMDIKRAENSFYYKIGYGQFTNTAEWALASTYTLGQIVSNGNYFYKSAIYNNTGNEPRSDSGAHWTQLCMIEDAYYSMNVKNFYFEAAPPKHAPVVTYRSDASRNINNLRQTLFQIAYRYIYMDWRVSTFSPTSIIALPQAEEEVATGLANEQTNLNNALNIIVNTGGEEVRQIQIVGRSSKDISSWFVIDTIDKFSEQEKGGELSNVIKPDAVSLGISIPVPVVLNGTVINPTQFGPAMTLPAPTVINTFVSADKLSDTWTSSQSGFTDRVNTTFSMLPTSATVKSIPSWITLQLLPATYLHVGNTIHDGDVIAIYPTTANGGALRSGVIEFENIYGNICSIAVQQAAPTVPATISVVAGGGDFDVSDTSGTVTIGSTIIQIIFTPDNPDYGPMVSFDTVYTIKKNGTTVGTGALTGVKNLTSNMRYLTMTSQALSGDSVVVYLGHIGT